MGISIKYQSFSCWIDAILAMKQFWFICSIVLICFKLLNDRKLAICWRNERKYETNLWSRFICTRFILLSDDCDIENNTHTHTRRTQTLCIFVVNSFSHLCIYYTFIIKRYSWWTWEKRTSWRQLLFITKNVTKKKKQMKI